MTANPPSTLQIDQAKLFSACNHDTRLMAIMLTTIELITGERVEVNFAHTQTVRAIQHEQQLLLDALGIAKPPAIKKGTHDYLSRSKSS